MRILIKEIKGFVVDFGVLGPFMYVGEFESHFS
jgi:hypothetical protein